MAPSTHAAVLRWPGSVLRRPLCAQTWRDFTFELLSLAVSIIGFILFALALAASLVLALTPIGLWALAAVLTGARLLGRVQLWLVGHAVGEPIPAPTPLRTTSAVAWRRATVSDPVAWRASAYLLAKLPAAFLASAVALGFWAYGILFLLYPLIRPVDGLLVRDRYGHLVHGFKIGGVVLNTWPTETLVSLFGVLLLLIAPYAMHTVVNVDQVIARTLLAAGAEERVRELARQRNQAIDQSAATLRSIERDLHDGTQAHLVALAIHLTMIREALSGEADVPMALQQAEIAHRRAKDAMTDLRELIRGFHPPVLDAGLEPALQTLAAGCGVPVDLRVIVLRRAPAAIESIAYFCTAELLTNVTKHSHARQVCVEVTDDRDRLRVTVTDDGVGGAAATKGTGLSGLADRVHTVDGTLRISSPPGGPTVATVELPTRRAGG